MNDKEIKKALELTCFNSLGYCCSLVKPCPSRDRARELLGISDEDYEKLKKEFDERVKKFLNQTSNP